jgi:hypothetical protein
MMQPCLIIFDFVASAFGIPAIGINCLDNYHGGFPFLKKILAAS